MSASQFIASLVSSLAWPAVVVTILVIFRRQFGTMLERLSRLKLGAGGPEAGSDWERTEDTVRQSLSSASRAPHTPRMAGPGLATTAGRPHQGQPPRAPARSGWSMTAGPRWSWSCAA
jgi:hypothetical protein